MNKNKQREVLSHSHHHNREDLAGEARFGDMGQIICLIVFMIIWVLDSFIFRFSTILQRHIPFYLCLPVTVVLLAVSFYLAKSGLTIVFREEREKPQVITKGVFGIVRHPIYLASLLFYLGLVISTLSLLSLAVWIIIFLFHNYIASYEEKLLVNKFGEQYKDYKKKTGKWLPKL